jgi:hypothetical protein
MVDGVHMGSLEQIDTKCYADRLSNLPIIKIGAHFDFAQKRISEWLVVSDEQ